MHLHTELVLQLLTTLRLDPARMQLISGFIDTYLNLNQAEEQTFKAAISTMGLEQREEYMEIITSWEQKGAHKALEQVAINSLHEGLSVEVVARITGLTIEQVQQLQVELQSGNK